MPFEEKNYLKEKFTKLSLVKETFKGLVFEDCEFLGCSFIECRFELCSFLHCLFNGCTLSASVPLDCRFSEVKFQGCKVIGMDWTRVRKIADLEFAQSQINYSNFRFLSLAKIKIIQCEAKEVDFIESDLSGADFRETDFEKSRFFKTNLSGASFKGARNYTIDVKNNILKKTRFSMPEAMGLLSGLDIILE